MREITIAILAPFLFLAFYWQNSSLNHQSQLQLIEAESQRLEQELARTKAEFNSYQHGVKDAK